MQQTPSGGAPGTVARTDREFAMTAAVANRFEVVESELALVRANDPKLKEFAQLMIRDHGTALNELQAAARSADVALPAEITLDQAHQTKVDALKARKGGDFDHAYRLDQVQAHREALALLDTYRTSGGNQALRDWATKTMATVRTHQQHLEKMGDR